MIKRFNPFRKKTYISLLDFIKKNSDSDFYLTMDNKRNYIKDTYVLKRLFMESSIIFTLKENGDYLGLILLWKSIGGDKKRYYVKLVAINADIGEKMITNLLWNSDAKDIYAKISKDSIFLLPLKKKGFKFLGGRGNQILLSRKNFKLGE